MEEPHFIKCEPGLLTVAEDTSNCEPNMLLPNADKIAEVKVEPHQVFADGSLEDVGGSIVKEEFEIEDFKLETQDEECNTAVDTLQEFACQKVWKNPCLSNVSKRDLWMKKKNPLTR
ncbi:uncharacterized protein [Anabrus simplex]|uniref:uncharacterized protein n=1 Tax=Anabrus simplex TaxID=316456 RepID=UPI0035A2C64E